MDLYGKLADGTGMTGSSISPRAILPPHDGVHVDYYFELRHSAPMALELRPNCEGCDRDLPPASADAMICTYECTWCRDCVARLRNVCPNCGGGLTSRPIRPATEWRPGLSVAKRPPSAERVRMSYTWEDAEAFAARLAGTAPEDR